MYVKYQVYICDMICFLIGKNVILFHFLQQIYGIVQHDNNPKVIWLWQSVEGYTVRRFSPLRIRKLCINKFIFGEINIYCSSITHSRHRHSAFPIVYPVVLSAGWAGILKYVKILILFVHLYFQVTCISSPRHLAV